MILLLLILANSESEMILANIKDLDMWFYEEPRTTPKQPGVVEEHNEVVVNDEEEAGHPNVDCLNDFDSNVSISHWQCYL